MTSPSRLEIFANKFLGLFLSKRMWAASAAAAIAVLREPLGLSNETSSYLVGILLAWAAGDALDPTGSLLLSRRFWMAVAAVAVGVLAHAGIVMPVESLADILLPLATAILAASYRPVLSATEKVHAISERSSR